MFALCFSWIRLIFPKNAGRNLFQALRKVRGKGIGRELRIRLILKMLVAHLF